MWPVCYFAGCSFFNFIDSTLQLLHNNSSPFGGVNVIAFGDPIQLLPVGDSSLFSDPETLGPFQKRGQLAYRQLKSIILSENNRQKDSPEFFNLLENLRNSTLTESDVNLLRSRLYTNLSEQERETFAECIHVYPYNNQCEAEAVRRLISRNKPVLKLETRQIPAQPRIVADYPLYLQQDVELQITDNLSVFHGLVNGRNCTLVKPLFLSDDLFYPRILLVKIPDWTGPTTANDAVPIPMKNEKIWNPFTEKKVTVQRFPLKQHIASTLHKASRIHFNFKMQFSREFYLIIFIFLSFRSKEPLWKRGALRLALGKPLSTIPTRYCRGLKIWNQFAFWIPIWNYQDFRGLVLNEAKT